MPKISSENIITLTPDAEKMASIARMASVISHDFNNILQVVNGYSQLAKEMVEPESDLDSYIDYVIDGGIRARSMIDQLVRFSCEDNHRLSAVDIDKLLTESTGNIEKVLSAGQSLRIEAGAKGKTAMGGYLALSNAIVCLCANAAEAMHDGGEVTVRSGILTASPNQSEHSKQDCIYVEVSDTGPGISPEIGNNIFDPYFTTKKKGGGGKGLGLTTVYATVRNCNGWIKIKTALGEGTIATIFLPMSGEQEESATKVGEPHENDASAKKAETGLKEGGALTILIAEDEEMVRNFTSKALQHAGFKVMEAENGTKALQLYKESSNDIDLLLLDVVMPGMRGTGVRDEVRRLDSKVPIIFITGYSESHTSLDLDDLPDNEMILYKPCEVRDIVEAINSLT